MIIIFLAMLRYVLRRNVLNAALLGNAVSGVLPSDTGPRRRGERETSWRGLSVVWRHCLAPFKTKPALPSLDLSYQVALSFASVSPSSFERHHHHLHNILHNEGRKDFSLSTLDFSLYTISCTLPLLTFCRRQKRHPYPVSIVPTRQINSQWMDIRLPSLSILITLIILPPPILTTVTLKWTTSTIKPTTWGIPGPSEFSGQSLPCVMPLSMSSSLYNLSKWPLLIDMTQLLSCLDTIHLSFRYLSEDRWRCSHTSVTLWMIVVCCY